MTKDQIANKIIENAHRMAEQIKRGKDIEIEAIRLINEDIQNILGDLQISTELKFKIDEVLFSDLSIAKKRIEIRKLKNAGLERKYVLLFINLLEYIEEV